MLPLPPGDQGSRFHIHPLHTLMPSPSEERLKTMPIETTRTQREDKTTQPADNSRRRFLKVSSVLSLGAAFSPRTVAETFAYAKAKTTEKENIMTPATATGIEQAADQAAIRPFQFNFADAELTDLRR